MKKIVFILKANKYASWSIRCVLHWIEAIRIIPNSAIIILCDNNDLKDRLLCLDSALREDQFVKSKRDSAVLKSIVETDIFEPYWKNIAYAHLSTFLIAEELECDEFWNIDADDTFFCLTPKRLAEVLISARNEALSKNIDIFSLDMWYSRLFGYHWTFGVTYTNNSPDWLSLMKQHINDISYETYKPEIRSLNIDRYFTYLKDTLSSVCFGTFYCNNLKFIHYSDDMFDKLVTSGFFYWHDGNLFFPLLIDCAGSKESGIRKIAEDCINIEVGISAHENMDFFINNGADHFLIQEYSKISVDEIESKSIMSLISENDWLKKHIIDLEHSLDRTNLIRSYKNKASTIIRKLFHKK